MPTSVVETAAEPTPWLTVTESAKRAKCGVKVIYAAVTAHQLKAVKVGLAWRIHVEWLDAWLDAAATVVNEDAPGREIPFAHLRR